MSWRDLTLVLFLFYFFLLLIRFFIGPTDVVFDLDPTATLQHFYFYLLLLGAYIVFVSHFI